MTERIRSKMRQSCAQTTPARVRSTRATRSSMKAKVFVLILSKYIHAMLVDNGRVDGGNSRTDKPHFTPILPWLRSEPFPHERACGPVVHRSDQTVDVVVHLTTT